MEIRDKNGLLCCKCSCECGGEDDEKIVCVHVLSVIMKLSHLLFDGLAEHLLVELSSIWGKTTPPFKSKKQEESTQYNIYDLMCSVSTDNIDERYLDGSDKSISELLTKFNVGTENKRIYPGHHHTITNSYHYVNSTMSIRLPSLLIKLINTFVRLKVNLQQQRIIKAYLRSHLTTLQLIKPLIY